MEKPSTTAWKAAKREDHKTTRYCYHSLSRKIKMNRVYNYKPIQMLIGVSINWTGREQVDWLFITVIL